jgi:hypothetical protein
LLGAAVIKWGGDNFPEALFDFTMDHLTVMAEAAIALAGRYEITGQPQVCAFANLMWLYGPNFDDIPKIRKILAAPRDQEEKIEQLYTKVPEALWTLADKKRDEGRWIDILTEEATGGSNE